MMNSKIVFSYFTILIISSVFIGCRKTSNTSQEKVVFREDELEITGPSLIQNGSFEGGLNKWLVNVFFKGKILKDKGLDDSNCLEIVMEPNNPHDGLGQDIHWKNESEYILVEGWIKTIDLKDNRAFIFIECVNKNKEELKTDIKADGVVRARFTERIAGTTDWKKVSIGIKVPKQTSDIGIAATVSSVYGAGPNVKKSGSGTVYFDNIAVYPAKLKE